MCMKRCFVCMCLLVFYVLISIVMFLLTGAVEGLLPLAVKQYILWP